jgi:hypothetical protein
MVGPEKPGTLFQGKRQFFHGTHLTTKHIYTPISLAPAAIWVDQIYNNPVSILCVGYLHLMISRRISHIFVLCLKTGTGIFY